MPDVVDVPRGLVHQVFRESRYALEGRQVAPQAAGWAEQIHLRVLDQSTIHSLALAVPRYPDPTPVLTGEIAFLNHLAAQRHVPDLLLAPAGVQQKWDELVVPGVPGSDRPVAPLSLFLQQPLVPWQTPDAVTEPGPHVVNTGAGLARYFQDETPGLPHRLAVHYLYHQQRLGHAPDLGPVPSPPAQALVWATLDVAISSALLAAWYVKWVLDPTGGPGKGAGVPGRARRPRPVEAPHVFDLDRQQVPLTSVLYDPPPPAPPATSGLLSPGTPRHPAYPAGHSTAAAAASTVLAAFFPPYAEAFRHLDDNTGMARLWAGVHWPSDHVAGQDLGVAVGNQVLSMVQPLDTSSGPGLALDDPTPLLQPPPLS